MYLKEIMNRFATLTELSARRSITAHRGASYEFPENTALSMEKAIEAGADMIEFDLRATRDHVPVLLHDSTVDRTSNGSGKPESYTLTELKRLNFSYFRHNERLAEPFCKHLEIPTFEEILEQFRGKAGMNIQIYLDDEIAMRKACDLFLEYEMGDLGYFTVTPKTADRVLPGIELCLTDGWHERSDPANLKRCKERGCRFVQPTRESVTAETFRLCRELGLSANVFFTDDAKEAARQFGMGAGGVLTNRPEQL